jgi:glycosyltransferase involved in cell wall biosynthesis
MKAAAIVPAYNEEKTVGDVVRTLVGSGRFGQIIVMSDGSTDGTAEAAREGGATLVHETPDRRGKGAVMGHGVALTDAAVVCFFDADLLGLTKAHVAALLDPVEQGRLSMHVGRPSRPGQAADVDHFTLAAHRRRTRHAPGNRHRDP